jgi:hypothetical protein
VSVLDSIRSESNLSSVTESLSMYALLTLPIVLAIWFSSLYIPRQSHPLRNDSGFFNSFFAWDGVWYSRIAEKGYPAKSGNHKELAFFPGYPVLARTLAISTGLAPNLSLLIVSHLCLAGIYILIPFYVRSGPSAGTQNQEQWTLLALGCFPTAFFFRMAYSESLFVFLLLISMYGMRRKWPVLIIAILVGYATACRAVGVALLPVLLVHTSRRFATSINRSDRIRAAAKVAFTMLVGAWGIIAMLCFHCWQYGNPIAFASVQSNWYLRPLPSLLPHALNLLSGVPLRDVYNSNSPAFWANFEYISDPIFSLQFSNPLYVSLSIFLVIFGTWKRWITFEETILSFGLIFIPYILHSYQTVMMAQGRYAASVFPIYLILGRIASQWPPTLASCLLCSGMAMSVAYSALFAAWFRMI